MPEIGKQLLCVARELRRAMDDNLRQKGLTHPQIHVLGYLDYMREEGKECNQREICAICGNVRASSVTSLLSTLERQGYIMRRRGNDGREKFVSLTDEGLTFARSCKQFNERMSEQLLSGFSEEEQAQFFDYLSRATENLQEGAKSVPAESKQE